MRRLLREWVPPERIVAMLNGRGNELERMRLGGVEIVARLGGGGDGGATEDHFSSAGPAERWNRVRVVPGIELHLRGGLPKPKPAELKQILAQIETALRKNL